MTDADEIYARNAANLTPQPLPMITPEMIERAARAIYEGRNGRGCKPWSRLPQAHQAPYLLDAQAALTAALGDTHVVVPRDVLEPFGHIVGEGDEDYADSEPAAVKFGRTTAYLSLGDFRRLHAVEGAGIPEPVRASYKLSPAPTEKGGEG